MLIGYDDFRGVSSGMDFLSGLSSLFKVKEGIPGLEYPYGFPGVRSVSTQIARTMIAEGPLSNKLAVRFKLTNNTGSSGLGSFGISASQFNEEAHQTNTAMAPFYISIFRNGSTAGEYICRIHHVILPSTGTSMNSLIIADSPVFLLPTGATKRFDFAVDINASDIATMKVAVEGVEILSATVNVERIATTRAVRSVSRVNLSPLNALMSEVVIYEPDADTAFPLYDIEIAAISSVSADASSGPANDATSIAITSGDFQDIALSGGIPAGANVLAAKAFFRYSAAGGNSPTYPQFALDFQEGTIGQIDSTPAVAGVGELPRVLTIRPSQPLTPALLNGARLRVRNREAT